MNLQNIVRDAAGGFVCGLALGLTDPSYKIEEALEVLDAIPEDKREEFGVKSASSPNLVRYMKRQVSNTKLLGPYIVGGLYATLVSLANQTALFENFAVAVPSAYLGRFVGKGIRLYEDRDKRRRIKTLKKVLNDPDNAEKYVLSEDQVKEIDRMVDGIGDDILLGKENLGKYVGKVQRVYDILTQNPGPYTNVLLDNNLLRMRRALGCAILQKGITNFYENKFPVQFPSGVKERLEGLLEMDGSVQVAFVGSATTERSYVVLKEGDKFFLQSIEWPNLKIIRKDGLPGFFVEFKEPVLGEKVRNPPDYKAIAKRIVEDEGTPEVYSAVLLKSNSEIPDQLKRISATNLFIPSLENFLSSRVKKNDQN